MWDRWDRWDRVCGLFRDGDVAGLRLVESALDGALGHIEGLGDVTDGLAVTLELEDFDNLVVVVGAFTVLEVVVLFGVALEFELQEAAAFGHIIDDDILGIVAVFSGADLDLLEVAEVVVLRAAGKSYAGIEEVYELGGACKVILGNRLPSATLGRVGDDDGREAVFLLEPDEFHHKAAGGGAFLGVVADEGNVVNHEELGSLLGGFLNGVEDFLLEVGPDYEFGVNLGTAEVCGEDVDFSGVHIAVTHLELFCGEFKVHVHNLLGPCYVLGYLDSQNGFADIAGGEDYGVLVLDNQVVEVHLGIRCLDGVLNPSIRGFDGEEAYAFWGALGFLDFLLDSGDRI